MIIDTEFAQVVRDYWLHARTIRLWPHVAESLRSGAHLNSVTTKTHHPTVLKDIRTVAKLMYDRTQAARTG